MQTDDKKEKNREVMLQIRSFGRNATSGVRFRIENSKDKIEIENARFLLWCKELDRSEANLAKLLVDLNDEEKLREVILAVADERYENLVPALIDILDTTSRYFVREAAALALAVMPDQKLAYGSLVRSIKQYPDTRECVIYCLQAFDCSSAVEILVDEFISSPEFPMVKIGVLGCFEEDAVKSIATRDKAACLARIKQSIGRTDDSSAKEELKDLYGWVLRTKVAV